MVLGATQHQSSQAGKFFNFLGAILMLVGCTLMIAATLPFIFGFDTPFVGSAMIISVTALVCGAIIFGATRRYDV